MKDYARSDEFAHALCTQADEDFHDPEAALCCAVVLLVFEHTKTTKTIPFERIRRWTDFIGYTDVQLQYVCSLVAADRIGITDLPAAFASDGPILPILPVREIEHQKKLEKERERMMDAERARAAAAAAKARA